MSRSEKPTGPTINPDQTIDPQQAKRMRWAMGLLIASGVSVMIGFIATQYLSDRSAERLGGPSSEAAARVSVPSSEPLTIEEPGTYDLYYEKG